MDVNIAQKDKNNFIYTKRYYNQTNKWDGKHNEVELQIKPTPKIHYIRVLFATM